MPNGALRVKAPGRRGTAPLIVPHPFGNAYNMLRLRQYFLRVPREMEVAVTVDGAGPLLTAVALFHPVS